MDFPFRTFAFPAFFRGQFHQREKKRRLAHEISRQNGMCLFALAFN
jgi:hypothetical protein